MHLDAYNLDILNETDFGTHDETTGCPKIWWPHTAASRHIDLLDGVGTLPRKALGQGGLLPLTYSVGCGVLIPPRQLATPLLCVALQPCPVLTARHILSLSHPIQRRPGMRAWHVLLPSTGPLHRQIISLPCAAVDIFWFEPDSSILWGSKMCTINPSIYLVKTGSVLW